MTGFIITIVILSILLIVVIKDDLKQRSVILKIKNEYDKLFGLVNNLTTFYNNMLSRMRSLDVMGGYETQDDFGTFFKYVRQSLYDINKFFHPDKNK